MENQRKREFFLSSLKDCEDKIKQQTEKALALKRIYLRENAEFEAGEKVEIKTLYKSSYVNTGEPADVSRYKIRLAYVHGATISKDGRIIYKLHRVSPNGHETKINDYLGKNETIHRLGTYTAKI